MASNSTASAANSNLAGPIIGARDWVFIAITIAQPAAILMWIIVITYIRIRADNVGFR